MNSQTHPAGGPATAGAPDTGITGSRPGWLLADSGPGDAAFNMAFDEVLLAAMPRLLQPVLRFYRWTEPAASFGYFQKYAEIERATLLRPLVRRPTGGGLVPHDADWTYSLVFPVRHEWYGLRAAESYHRVHTWIQAAFHTLNVPTQLAPDRRLAAAGQCFAGHEISDVLRGGMKIAGAAQRRTRDGLLIQGSVQPPPGLARSAWQQAMLTAAPFGPAPRWMRWEPDGELRQAAARLAREKYGRDSYNRKR